MRIAKFMAAAGVASRRKSEELILQGKVKVNGKTVSELGLQVDPEQDQISHRSEERRVGKECRL